MYQPCSSTFGQLPPGTCSFDYHFLAGNGAAAGTGTLVPGSATLVVELQRTDYVSVLYRAPITLQ